MKRKKVWTRPISKWFFAYLSNSTDWKNIIPSRFDWLGKMLVSLAGK